MSLSQNQQAIKNRLSVTNSRLDTTFLSPTTNQNNPGYSTAKENRITNMGDGNVESWDAVFGSDPHIPHCTGGTATGSLKTAYGISLLTKWTKMWCATKKNLTPARWAIFPRENTPLQWSNSQNAQLNLACYVNEVGDAHTRTTFFLAQQHSNNCSRVV